jgi:hypothetical protein
VVEVLVIGARERRELLHRLPVYGFALLRADHGVVVGVRGGAWALGLRIGERECQLLRVRLVGHEVGGVDDDAHLVAFARELCGGADAGAVQRREDGVVDAGARGLRRDGAGEQGGGGDDAERGEESDGKPVRVHRVHSLPERTCTL